MFYRAKSGATTKHGTDTPAFKPFIHVFGMKLMAIGYLKNVFAHWKII